MTTTTAQSSHPHEIPDSASKSLTPAEQEQLTLCERTISTGWQTFVEVGLALSTIREERLYRTEYPSFEVYCSSKWQFHRAYAYRLMTAAQVVKALSPIGDTPAPANEAQVRPLVGLPPDQMRETWAKACAAARDGNPTSRLVAKMAAAFRPNNSAHLPVKTGKLRRIAPTAQPLVHAFECLDALEDDIRQGQANLADLAYISEVRRDLRLLQRQLAKRSVVSASAASR